MSRSRSSPDVGREPKWLLSPWVTMIAAGLIGAAIVVARRPDAVTNPQFFAEDGSIWFAQAFNHGGLHALTISYAGYLQTLPRLVALVGVRLNLPAAAALFNSVGLLIQLAPAVFFVSPRFDSVVSQRWARVLLALLYLLLPAADINVTLTNAMWHLALLALLVVIAPPPRSRLAVAADAAVLTLCALTGPFGFLLLPLLGWRWWRDHNRGRGVEWIALAVATLVQTGVMVGTTTRDHLPLGASLSNLVLIFDNRIVLNGSLAQDQTSVLRLATGADDMPVALLIAAAAVVVLVAALLRGPTELRLLLLFGFGVVALALISPVAAPTGPQWTALATTDGAERYFLVAEVGWVAAVVWLLTRLPGPAWSTMGLVMLGIVFGLGLYAGFQYPPMVNLHPARYSARLATAPRGSVVVVPLNPVGWQMKLVART